MCTQHTNVPTAAPTTDVRPAPMPGLSAGGPALSSEVARAIEGARAQTSMPARPTPAPIEVRTAPAPAPARAPEVPVAAAIEAPRVAVAAQVAAAAPEALGPRTVRVGLTHRQKTFVAQHPTVAIRGGHRLSLRVSGNECMVTVIELKDPSMTDDALKAAVKAWIEDKVR